MIGALLCGAGLAAGALAMARPRRLPYVRASGSQPGAGLVSVVVPARNEAATLPALLRSLDHGRALVREVIVVDDNSSDDTATVASVHGATVVRLDREPPPGWTGKNHACASGAALASAPLLLFLDADVVLEENAVARFVCAHAAHGGLVSVQPYHTVTNRYEELSAGCNIVSMMGSGAFAAWRSRARPAAFGPSLMTSADDYARVGGHACVRGEVVEDICLAQRYADEGLPVSVFLGYDAVSFRMYPRGLRQLVEGWTKNLALGARSAQPIAVAAA
ncbi:MAG TPA: glycosyltransferase family 2 protein, partial [Ilumatobacter sp.]